MRPTAVRSLGGVVEIHPFKHHCATNSTEEPRLLIVRSKAAGALVADLKGLKERSDACQLCEPVVLRAVSSSC
jgi:hypothetical protein